MILIDAIAANPIISDVCRWLLEAGFKGEKSVLQKELPAMYERILDMGCGTGMMTSLFSPVNYSGIDPNQKHISWARKKASTLSLHGYGWAQHRISIRCL